MAAHLYPGIKSLHLQLDTPYDLIRTDDIRDDLSSVKVWISDTTGFNPAIGEGSLVFDGLSLSIVISNLDTNKQYYVRYAFISKIDPSTYTISNELTQIVYDENTKVYGYLTNDPTGISTNSDGTGGDFSLAAGVFKVFNLSQEVTGNGVSYSIKPGSIVAVTGAYIDPVTGEYSCTGLTSDTGIVSFLATYGGVTIQQDWNIFKGLGGKNAPTIKLTSIPGEFIYKDQYATSSETSSATITAKLTNLTGIPVFSAKAYTSSNTLLGDISFTQVNPLEISITGAQFGFYGVNTKIVVVTAALDTVEDSSIIYRINNGTDQITVELTNPAHPIPAGFDGSTTSSDYVGSGTKIYVKQGNIPLKVDPTSPYEELGSWNIFSISSSGITCDPTPIIGTDYIEFDAHSAMTADTAYIDYTILYRTTTGQVGSQTVRQSFSRTKAGISGTALVLSQTGPGHTYNTEGLNPQPPSQEINAALYNFNNAYTYYYEFIVDGITQQNTTSTSYTYTPKASYNDMPDYVLVKVRRGSSTGVVVAEDELVIVGVKAGSNAIVTWVKNPIHQLPVSASGEITYLLSGCEIMAAEGTTVLTASNLPNASMPNGSFKAVANGVGITPSSSVTYSGQVISYGDHNTATSETPRITYNLTIKTLSGKIVTDYFQQQNFNLKRDGKDAVNTATIYLYSRNDSITTPPTFSQQTTTYNFNTKELSQKASGWYYTIPSDTLGKTIWVTQALVASDPGSYTDTVLNTDWSTPVTLAQSVPGTTGLQGLVSKVVYAVVTQTSSGIIPPNTPSGNTPSSPWQTAVPSAGVGQIIYYSYGRYNPNTVSVDGVAADTTVWSSPIGASVFQDIRSDNWTGGTPTGGTFTSTTGYYLNRSEGSFYGNNVYLIGTLKAGSIIQGGATIAGTLASDVVNTANSASSTASSAYNLANTANSTANAAYDNADYATTQAAAANAGLLNKLNKNANDTIGGILSVDTTTFNSGIKIGTVSWNTSGTLSGSGLALTKNGLFGVAGGQTTFSINAATGEATFSGTIDTYNSVLARGTLFAQGTYTNLSATVWVGDGTYNVRPAIASNGEGSNTYTNGALRVGIYGFGGNCSNSSWNVGVLGVGSDAGKGIGVAGSGTQIGVYGYSSNSATAAIQGRSTGGTGQAGAFEGYVTISSYLTVGGNITSQANIIAYGNVTAYSTSDIRFKENVVKIDSSLRKLAQVSGYMYSWKDSYLQNYTQEVKDGLIKKDDSGLIAQEVLEVFPEAVFTRKDGTLSVDYKKLIPYMLEAIKELDRRTA